MPPAAGKDWDRLGQALTERRAQLDPRYRNRRLFASERGMNWRTLHDIEAHKRENFQPETLMAVASAYEVTYASLLATLEGGELQGRAAPPAPVPPGPAEEIQLPRDVAVQMEDVALRSIAPEILAQVQSELARNPRAAGRDIFPDWPKVAEVWDLVAPLSLHERVVYAATARLQELRQEWRGRRSG